MTGSRAQSRNARARPEAFCRNSARINVRETWAAEFANKKVTALYQGFLNAAKNAELADTILVKQYDGQVYLLHKERALVNVTDNITDDTSADDESAEDSDDEVTE